MEIELLLRMTKSPAPGCDNIPSWVFKTCRCELVGIIAFIVNYTFQSGEVPSTSLTAIVTPVPKVPNPLSLIDFRPISVTPILSRLAERFSVGNWLQPANLPNLIYLTSLRLQQPAVHTVH